MGLHIVPLATAVAATAGATTAAYVNVAQVTPPDIWSIIQAGGAPMALVLFGALIEVVRRHDRAYKVIEQKDAVILEMAKRQVEALGASSSIASDQMKIAQNNDILMREILFIIRGGKAG